MCPNAAQQGLGSGGTYTPTAGPLDSTCGANSAVAMSVPNDSDYAKLTWLPSMAGYPAGLTLGNLGGLAANVTNQFGDNPFYMLAFTDPGDPFLDTTTGDQILMIEFQPSTVSGNSKNLNISTTRFNLYDNTAGCYLLPNGGCNRSGQQDTNSLSGWLAADPSLGSDSLQQIRIGVGMAGGSGPAAGVTVNSLETVPEPTSLLLVLTLVGATVLGMRLTGRRNHRS